MINLGQLAYDTYIEARGGVHPDGSSNPPRWDALGNDIQDAWVAVALKVREDLKVQLEENKGKFRF